ncbi:MAG: sugar phosphate isomerase/epimerase [Bryobacteraceae bacterium]|nr:sugar phosphate isomerase/epimerase [Bryobacteraceae bacterium]
MYISLQSTLTAGRVPWPEFARLAAKLGYMGTDVDGKRAQDAGLDATLTLLAQTRLKPAVVNLPVEFRKDDAAFTESLKGLDEAGKFAAQIGCPRMTTWIMSSSDLPKEEQWKIFRDRFTQCGQILSRHSVRLGLEFLGPMHIRKARPHEFIVNMAEMLAFTKECGPNVGILLDSWHWHHAGSTIQDILDAGKERIVHVQVADAPKLPPEQIRDNERLMPGEGILDWKAFFAALKKINYTDGISPEVFGRGLKDMPPEDGARLGLTTTTAVMKKAGVL